MSSSSLLLFLGLAIAAGSVVALQAPINARLGGLVGHPMWATLISFSVGVLSVAAYLLVARVPPALAGLASAPWWIWTGGMMGVFFVATALVAAPKLGAATLIAAVVAGQMVTSLLIDHYGWFGMPRQPMDLQKLAGAALLLAGLFLIRGR